MWQKFTEPARMVVLLSQQEAVLRNSAAVDTEHLLLGLAQQTEGVAAQVLASNDVSVSRVQAEVEKLAPQGERAVDEPKLTGRAKRTLQLAADEARQLRHSHIGAEHLLLALLRQPDGLASTIWKNLELDAGAMRSQVLIHLASDAVSVERMPTHGFRAAQPGDFDFECFDVFVEAMKLAKAAGKGVRSEHLLLALMKHRPEMLTTTFDVTEPNSKAARMRLYVNLDLYEEAAWERDRTDDEKPATD